ncbi:sensor histidine kinase [Hyphomicrobium sp. CS1GBMeth3]|uniref:sensor histidine kinase n=1 Tax=Hyphomicrobium sp. CS1GBMeth3 TaxID=1892845 RepID=UPI0015C53C4A|nr:sensor histidine kinase [Hyphomicrobium sp. CS1GBMeth3]
MPFSLRPPWPVSFLLALSIIALAIPLLALLGMEAARLTSSERNRLFNEARLNAERIAADLDQTMNGYIAILESLATTPALAEGDLATVYRQAEAALRPRGLYAFLRDSNGQMLFNTRLPYGAALPTTTGFDGQVISGNRAVISDVVIGEVAKRPVMAVSVPVYQGGDLRFVLSLSLEPSLMKELLDRQKMPPEWRATIVDRKGVVIARTRLHDEFVGKPLSDLARTDGDEMEGLDLEGRVVKWGIAPSRVSGWTVYVSVLSELVDAAARDALLNYVLIVAAFTCVGIAGAVGMARVITQPLDAAERAAKALGEGRAVEFKPTLVAEANAIGAALVEAAELREQAEQQIMLLMREVNHRSKNMLAVVQAIARQMPSNDPKLFVRQFSDRIVGLAASQDLLIESNWQGVRVADLVRSQLALFRELIGTRIDISGPPVRLQPPAAQAIGMALHELATNASKYGALSDENGKLRIKWHLEGNGENREFVLAWVEEDGPPVKPPERRGFGYTIMVAMVEKSLDATVTVDYAESGLKWTVRAPARCTYEGPETAGGPAKRKSA